MKVNHMKNTEQLITN